MSSEDKGAGSECRALFCLRPIELLPARNADGALNAVELDVTMAFCGHTQIGNVNRSIRLPGTYPT